MEPIKQESNNHPYSKKIVHGNSLEITEIMAKKRLIEPGSHNLLIYNDLKTLREFYSHYSKVLLPENEMVAIGTQYDPIDDVKNALRLSDVDVERYLNQGMLFIVDAQQGYQGVETHGMWKIAMSLLSHAKKGGIRGLTGFADLGSFFSFEKIEELMQYELWLPQKNEDDKMKIVCCYHSKNFEKLNETQKQTLFDHHFKSILIE